MIMYPEVSCGRHFGITWVQVAKISFLWRVSGHTLRDSAMLGRIPLRWLGHLVSMPPEHLPGDKLRKNKINK